MVGQLLQACLDLPGMVAWVPFVGHHPAPSRKTHGVLADETCRFIVGSRYRESMAGADMERRADGASGPSVGFHPAAHPASRCRGRTLWPVDDRRAGAPRLPAQPWHALSAATQHGGQGL